jgi:hypothetical protein
VLNTIIVLSSLFLIMATPQNNAGFASSVVTGIVGAALIFGGAMGYIVRLDLHK